MSVTILSDYRVKNLKLRSTKTRSMLVAVVAAQFLTSAAFALGDQSDEFAGEKGAAKLHLLSKKSAFYVGAVIETKSRLLVFDPGMTQEDAERINELSNNLDKPISGIFVTHGHIDHYGAVESLRSPSRPFLTGAGVSRQINEYDAINLARFGVAPATHPTPPDRIMGNGESIDADGVKVTLFDLGPGESYSDAWYLVEYKDGAIAFVGDVAMFGIPPFMQSGHSKDWLNSLAVLKKTVPDGAKIIIGHDAQALEKSDNARDNSIFDWQIARLEEFRNAVSAITCGERLLTPEEIEQVVIELNAKAPENRKEYNFLIKTTANVLAAELILERQKELFEEDLTSVLTSR